MLVCRHLEFDHQCLVFVLVDQVVLVPEPVLLDLLLVLQIDLGPLVFLIE